MEKVLERINAITSELHNLIPVYTYTNPVYKAKYLAIKAKALSCLEDVFGDRHPYYKTCNKEVYNHDTVAMLNTCYQVLISAKEDIEKGWLFTYKGLVAAELFSDSLEMADHLLSQNILFFKNPAAVMIGSTLELHLKQLCIKHGIEVKTTNPNNGKEQHLTADKMNIELRKKDVYDTGNQKQVTAWLDLRNNAAHGNYDKYTKEEVKIMHQWVQSFITRISL